MLKDGLYKGLMVGILPNRSSRDGRYQYDTLLFRVKEYPDHKLPVALVKAPASSYAAMLSTQLWERVSSEGEVLLEVSQRWHNKKRYMHVSIAGSQKLKAYTRIKPS